MSADIPLGAAAVGFTVAWLVVRLAQLAIDTWFRWQRRATFGEFDEDRAAIRALLASAHAMNVQLGDLHTEATVRLEQIRHLAEQAQRLRPARGLDTPPAPGPGGPHRR
jgi:hypothetical protein